MLIEPFKLTSIKSSGPVEGCSSTWARDPFLYFPDREWLRKPTRLRVRRPPIPGRLRELISQVWSTLIHICYKKNSKLSQLQCMQASQYINEILSVTGGTN